ALSRDHHELGRDFPLADGLEQRDTVQLRHLEIGEHDAETLVRQALERLLSVGGDFHLISFVAQDGAQAVRNRRLVVGDENSTLWLSFRTWRHEFYAGNMMSRSEPDLLVLIA